ncbi:MAG: hypothetical protein MUE81_12410 [Thermoflexibacter sp.]|jgi:uncharacterized protein HemX|nr:hypothetical protein [Thermoflexibacter sp.]
MEISSLEFTLWIVGAVGLGGGLSYLFFNRKLKKLKGEIEEIKKEYKKSWIDFEKKQKEFDLEIRARAKKLESVQNKVNSLEIQLLEKEENIKLLKGESEDKEE